MPIEVDTTPGGRRMTDKVPVNVVSNTTTSATWLDTVWIVLIAVFITAALVGGIAYVYHQSEMNRLRSDYQIQIERLQNQITTQQLQQQIQVTPIITR